MQPNPNTRDYKAGLQLGAAVLVNPTGENLYTFMLSISGLRVVIACLT